jgi:hypothetical protein
VHIRDAVDADWCTTVHEGVRCLIGNRATNMIVLLCSGEQKFGNTTDRRDDSENGFGG